jgi:hypothetical protein
MTVPMENWCEMCHEACHDHPTVCTVCGTGLTCAPSTSSSATITVVGGPNPSNTTTTTAVTGNNNTTTTTITTTAGALRSYLGDMRQASQDLRDVLGTLRGQVQDLEMLTRNILAHQQQQQQQERQDTTIPPELLWNPQNFDPVTSSRPTSQKTLEQMPRIVLDDKSTLFRQGSLQVLQFHDDTDTIDGDETTNVNLAHGAAAAAAPCTTANYAALIGEFGPMGEHHYQSSTLVVASPLTGKGGLTDKTINDISVAIALGQVIVFLQRGDGLTFVQKALLAQKAGASAVIIGNNTSSPWPYVMKDSYNEAETHHLSIPVVMVKLADAQEILKKNRSSSSALLCNLHITSQSHDCVVCCERLETSETVVQLPGCAHIFHEQCVMAWLKSHNTCPYCRRELPTDDAEYEHVRRQRQQQQQQGTTTRLDPPSSGDNRMNSWNEYYG